MRKLFTTPLLTIVLLTLFSYSLSAQSLGGMLKKEKQKDPVSWTTQVEKVSDNEYNLIFKAKADPHWHFYSQYSEGTMPMAFYFDDIVGFRLVGEVSESPKPKEEYDKDLGGLTKYWDEKTPATFVQNIKITTKEKVHIHGSVEFQACINGACMPITYNFTLSDDETYALVAYLLSINEIEIDGVELDDDYVLDRKKFLKIKMPNADGFVPNINGKDGLENVRKFNNNVKNFGNGKRCMKDCIDGKVHIVRIKAEMKDFHPPMSTKRDLPKVEASAGSIHPGKKVYEETCSVCHATDKMGAPDVGNKEAWTAVVKKGKDIVYANGIKGINGMPPKGGKTDLSDAQFKEVVDYMIEASK